jgi:uncharacterized protein
VMKLENEFTVNVPAAKAWDVLLDLERVTPCLPGAELTEQTDDGEYKGKMTVRLGPVSQEYQGTVSIEEADESEHRAVLKADGQDARGQGTASATITSTLHEENGGESTRVHVETDMQITGRAAQFGQGIQQDVAEKIMGQFAECLENEILGTGEESEQSEEEPSADGVSEDAQQGQEPLDLGGASREAVLKRAVPVAAGAIVLVVVVLLLRGRRRRR